MDQPTRLATPYLLSILFIIGTAIPLSYAFSEENTSSTTDTNKSINNSQSYSLNASSMSAMEQQLKSMLTRKIIKTPEINPTTALPPVILKSAQEAHDNQKETSLFFPSLISAAKERTQHDVRYDGSYRYINYPMGDVPPNRGVCTDVVIRSYRKLGVDLQQLVHEDIKQNFSLYPSRMRWGNIEPDPNIDHRRVYNLQVFFQRFAQPLPITQIPSDYQPGDLVTWELAPKMPHIGIIVNEYSESNPDIPLIVHNIGQGPKTEDILFTFAISGHYRYKPGKTTPAATTPFKTLLVKRKTNTAKHSSLNLMEAARLLLP